MARVTLTHYTAGCLDCARQIAAKNAMGWAAQHANRTGHKVEVSLGYVVIGTTDKKGEEDLLKEG